MFEYKFWKDAFERAVFTGAEAALAVVGVDAVSAFEIDWKAALGVALAAAAASGLKSLAAKNVGDGSASLVQVRG